MHKGVTKCLACIDHYYVSDRTYLFQMFHILKKII